MVDKSQLYSIGICAGASYAAYNYKNDDRLKALGLISPFLTSSEEQGSAIRKSILTIVSNIMRIKFSFFYLFVRNKEK